jgi:hypothetical protein
MSIEQVEALLVSFGFAVVLAAMILEVLFLRRLQRSHPETWIGLGSPEAFPRGTLEGGRMLLDYKLRRRYKSLGDARLTAIGDWCNFCYFMLLVLGIVGFSLIMKYNPPF